MSDLAERLLSRLRERSLIAATAESLTGGLLSSAIVEVPGASLSFRGGVVTYASETKTSVLGVDADLLVAGGPVQGRVAEQMASGVARLFGANLGIATTGVAGPGDTADGPAGLVMISVYLEGSLSTVKYCFVGDREGVRCQAVEAALALAIEVLDR